MSTISYAQSSILTTDVNGVTKLHIRRGASAPVDPPPVYPPKPLSDYIGIPDPNWEWDASYRMYDDDVNQADGLTYYDSPSGGKYTHYVDWTADGATDTDNPYGKLPKDGGVPRKTIPQNLPAGSIVEVHDTLESGYTRLAPYGNTSYIYFNGAGTKTYPIFIRGVDDPKFFGQTCRISGAYVIVEGFNFWDEFLNTTYKQTSGPTYCHHICIRNNEIQMSNNPSGRMITLPSVQDVVVYNNHIHHNGLAPAGVDADVHGIGVTGSSSYVWVLNNEINNNDGDSVQIMGTYPDKCPQFVFVAGNTMYADRENAVDMKYSENCVIVQNYIYGYGKYLRLIGSDPNEKLPNSTYAAILPCNEYTINSWFLFNYIKNSFHGVQISNDKGVPHSQVYLIGNVIDNMIASSSMHWNKENDTWIANIVYDANTGIWNDQGGTSEGLSIHKYYNNLIVKTRDGWTSAKGAYLSNDYIIIRNSTAATNANMFNNLFYDGGGGWNWGGTIYETIEALEAAKPLLCINNVVADPLFTDPDNGNFTPQAGSPVYEMDLHEDAMAVLNLYYKAFGIDITGQVAQYFVDGTVHAPTGGL